jgi:hypothetical protein
MAAVVVAGLCSSTPSLAQSRLLDRLSDRLTFRTAGGRLALQASGLVDLEGYWIDQRPPGLVFGGDDPFLNPRFWLFVDARFGDQLTSFVQLRADRGFDPRSDSASARFDEYWIRWSPLDPPVVNLEVGKMATLVGSWVERHDSWENPLINAPAPYENVTIMTDAAAPESAAQFLARRNVPDKKGEWLPLIWGPAYTTGASVFGRFHALQYGFEVKNAAISARPTEWDGRHHGFDHPSIGARVGVHPDAAWMVGASFSRGPYLLDAARADLPAGRHVSDFQQTLVGMDASYAWRRLELWAEVFLDRFEVPNVEDADALAYYLEGRLGLTASLFAALRWNQEMFARVDDGAGRRIPWDRDLWRIDSAFGYRLDRHWQGKLQYSYSRQAGRLQQGEQLAAFQLTLKY